ncbi:MAG: hypothetical protein AAF384_03710 [Pseudomonadota bacterium]
MPDITGGCHCENIRYEFFWPLDGDQVPVRACGCDFCQKHGGVWASHPLAKLHLTATSLTDVSRYTFGHATAEFLFCTCCGSLITAISEIDEILYAVINVNSFDPIDPLTLSSRATDFESEDIDARLARRQRHWTPNVQLTQR